MTDCDALLAGIVADPLEETRWLVLADWLEEHDDPRRAELLRLHRRMLATCCEPDAHPDRAAWQARMVELLIAGVRPCVPQETIMLPDGVPMTFSFIPPGAFLMGSEKGKENEKPIRRVEIPRGFFMGIYPVTQAQWVAVFGYNPSSFEGEQRPLEGVLWGECSTFCEKLRELTGRRIDWPTEAEWECACRAGTTTDYYFGDTISMDLANYSTKDPWESDEIRKGTTPVGSFPVNPWGLYDMHGNVAEWCGDGGADFCERKFKDSRSVRGGSWGDLPRNCRSADHGRDGPDYESCFGLRVCLRLS